MKTNLFLALAGVFAFNEAQALPTIYPTDMTLLSSIVNKTNSNLVADDSDRRVIYVMPPNSASSTVSGLHSVNANVGFCKEMADTQNYSRSISQRIFELVEQERESNEQTDAIREKLVKARAEMANSATLGQLEEIIALDERLESIEARITALTDTLISCTQYCQNLRLELKELRAEKSEISKARRTLAAQHTKEVREYEKKKAMVAVIQQDLEERDAAWGKIKSRLNEMRNNFYSMYSAFGQMEGARAGITFKSRWDDNVDSLRSENPGFDFKKISTQKAVVTTSIAELNTIPSGGAILGYSIGGNYSEGKFLMDSYPQDMSANVRLSLLGTCPILHPDYFDIKVPNTTGEMKYGMTVAYEYPTAFVAEATATFNMYKMYQKIVSSGSSGGFFRSKSWSSVEEKTFFKDSFSVKWNEQDSANSIPDAQKLVLENDMRQNILARLAAIGQPAYTNAAMLVAPPVNPKTGAAVVSESLKSTCPGNYYCVGAAITMDVLQAIFGSSTTSASYTSIQDQSLTEEWSRTKVVYKPWISTYN